MNTIKQETETYLCNKNGLLCTVFIPYKKELSQPMPIIEEDTDDIFYSYRKVSLTKAERELNKL